MCTQAMNHFLAHLFAHSLTHALTHPRTRARAHSLAHSPPTRYDSQRYLEVVMAPMIAQVCARMNATLPRHVALNYTCATLEPRAAPSAAKSASRKATAAKK